MSNAEAALKELRADLAEDDAIAQAMVDKTLRERRAMISETPPKKSFAHLAITRNANAVDAEQMMLIASQPDSEIAEFNYATDAASLWLSYYRMPPRLRGFVDAICGLAGEREEWFAATDITIGKRMARSTKTVQRDRDDLDVWQRENRSTFIEIEDHVTDSKGKRHPHKYKVHLSRLAIEAKREAQASHKWADNPAKALEHAVKANLKSTPGMLPRKEHSRRSSSLEKTIQSDLRRAARLILKSAKNLKSAELNKRTRGYMLPVGLESALLLALEHSIQVLKGEAEPDNQILAPLDTSALQSLNASGQNVRNETMHPEILEEVAVNKEMPSAVPISEYWRVPSIARAARARGELPPQG